MGRAADADKLVHFFLNFVVNRMSSFYLNCMVVVNCVLNRKGNPHTPLGRGWALGTMKYAKRLKEMRYFKHKALISKSAHLSFGSP